MTSGSNDSRLEPFNSSIPPRVPAVASEMPVSN